jgi:hypothetical protein
MLSFFNFNNIKAQVHTILGFVFHPWKTIKILDQKKIDFLPSIPLVLLAIRRSWNKLNETFIMPDGIILMVIYIILGAIFIILFWLAIGIIIAKACAFLRKRRISSIYVANSYSYISGGLTTIFDFIIITPFVMITSLFDFSLIPTAVLLILIRIYALAIFIFGVFYHSMQKEPQQSAVADR